MYRVLYVAHAQQLTIAARDVHKRAVRELELSDKRVERGAWVTYERAHEDLGDSVCTDERREKRVVLRRRDAEDVPSHGGLEVYRAADPNTSLSAPAARADTTASEKGMRDVLVVLGIIDRISQYCPKSQAHRYRGPLLFVAGTVIITIITIVFQSCIVKGLDRATCLGLDMV